MYLIVSKDNLFTFCITQREYYYNYRETKEPALDLIVSTLHRRIKKTHQPVIFPTERRLALISWWKPPETKNAPR